MIVGTAGHIDHGKTTLVRALTGVDTDRLKEEKERGISIELGYAYTPLANGDVLGFVDVPGHERLIHTMVSGASGIDFALLVIAADDGVMPQTREHLAILELLGVERGAVAVTKIDRVADGRWDEVSAEIATLLAPTRLCDVPIFAVNSLDETDAGLFALRAHLNDAATRIPSRNHRGFFRLAVDRVFSLSGHGTIATGTVHSGRVRVGDEIAIMPKGITARVRGVHAQNRESETGRIGQRCAINLAGIEKSDVSRGDWLADARAFMPSSRIDVRLRWLDAAPKIGDWMPAHVHLGTLHAQAHLVPLEARNATMRVQLVFDKPVCATPGDRLIVRDAQAAHTIAGAVVLDPNAPARKRRSEERIAMLDAIESMLAGRGFDALLQCAPYGTELAQLERLSGQPSAETFTLPTGTRLVETKHGTFVFASTHWKAVIERVLARLRAFHEQFPDEAGVDASRLRRIAAPTSPETLWQTIVAALLTEHRVSRSGPWLHLPEHRVTMSDDEAQLAKNIQPLIAAARFDPPWVRELATTAKAREDDVRRTLRKLLTQGLVYQIVPDLFYDRDRIRELATLAAGLARENGAVEAAAFRDALGLGRKRTIQILEFFDRVGYTRRVRDSHRLRDAADAQVQF